ncbi:MAG TPA: glycoside hydrolase family 20 zincin-like fold domain-containing protein [Tepidisphaeraceae bacterium]|jgi:hypothetical protein|nr:glycoside hydrolase family 20 zincin-like fold domain-containing protein [Tepidisphaeraceae bacterium]
MNSQSKIVLVPAPRKVDVAGDSYPLAARGTIQIPAALLAQVSPAIDRLQEELNSSWTIGIANDKADIRFALDPSLRTEGYKLSIKPDGIRVVAHEAAGAFYAIQTLRQIIRQSSGSLPALDIEDWPDFPNRGVMLDISRDKVPTMNTLFALIDKLAELKINQVQLYTEHTFAYSRHAEVWKNASPMTSEQIRELDHFCRERFIELVPNQNSFGHMERWLKHPTYKDLAEAPDGFDFPWGQHMPTGFSLNPLDPRSIKLIDGMYDELLPNFSSKQFNVGCDETFDLGLGRSKEEVAKRGKEIVYLEFLLKIHKAAKSHGRTMQFWGDIILHKPDLIPQLPKDLIALNWGYEIGHPFAEQTAAFHHAGVPFYVCPGTSSWCSIAGRTDNALANLKDAADQGLAHGAIGYLNTDWGDYGHLQYLPTSYLGFVAGAAYSWCIASNRELDLATAMDRHVFLDRAGVMGKLMYDLGNVYKTIQAPSFNSSKLFWALVAMPDRMETLAGITKPDLDAADKKIDAILAPLEGARMGTPNAERIKSEVRNTAAMLKLGAARGRRKLDPKGENPADLATRFKQIIVEHRRLWLARNRPGGLNDSCARLEDPLSELHS